MPKIVITEQDLTSPGVIDESTDVVYIPGFVNLDRSINSNLYEDNGDGDYIGIQPNKPTLFSSISEFEAMCGVQPAYFSEDQTYASLVGTTPNADGSMPGFSSDAIPYHGVMFYGPRGDQQYGQADPSYVMAKEILSAGLSVLYERVNADDYTETFVNQSNAPEDWESNYQNYQIANSVLIDVTDTTVPTMFTKQNGEIYNPELTYYTRGTAADPEDAGNPLTIAFIPVNESRQEGAYYQEVSTSLNDEGQDIISDAVTGSVPEYFVLTSSLSKEQLEQQNIEVINYYTKTQISFTTYEPVYEANTYYVLQNGQYIQLTSTTPPTDWGVGEYYSDTEGTRVQFVYQCTPAYVDSQFYKFNVVTGEQPEDWESGTYYKRSGSVGSYIYEQKTAEDEYSEGTYYKLEQVSGPQPSDWGTSDEYCSQVPESDPATYQQVTFSPSYIPTFSTASSQGTVIRFDADNNFYTEVTSEPSDWGTAQFYVRSTEPVSPLSLPQPPDPETLYYTGTYYIPHSWVVGYSQGVQTSIEYVDVQGVQTSGGFVAPVWNAKATYRLPNDGINIANMYNSLQSLYAITDTGLSDKGNYSIKYLTSGGYPVYEYSQNALVTQMMNLCVERGDCVAFIDHTDNPYRNQNIDQPGSLYYTVKNDLTFQTNGEFATMFTPWATYNRTTTDLDEQLRTADGYDPTIRMPASFAYFLGLGDSVITNPNWLAIAGVARGLVQNLSSGGMTTNIPNGAADKMSPRDGIAINPITNIRPYGYTIWGNRTLKNNATQGNLTATSFLNIRNLVSDIKKEVYRVCRKLTFEQNSDVLWANFKSELTPLLDRMLHGYGISNYKLQKDVEHPRYNERATLCVKIIISPVEAVEDFYVSIVMQDDEDVDISE